MGPINASVGFTKLAKVSLPKATILKTDIRLHISVQYTNSENFLKLAVKHSTTEETNPEARL
jgi:hypothetical protein